MKKSMMINLALGACALGIASLAATPQASAATWSNTIGPNGVTQWFDGGAVGIIVTGAANATFYTNAGTAHTGGYFVKCSGVELYGFGGATWTGSAIRNLYNCPGFSPVTFAQGWLLDN